MKVGDDPADDRRRAALVRDEIGPDRTLMMDANGRWGVQEAIDRMRDLAPFNPWWIEEPTSPDDVLGHAAIRKAIAPIGVATGEQCQNRVLFKQFLQAHALRLLSDRQLPAGRRQRSARGTAHGGEVRRPGVSARRRRRPVRVCAAPGRVRLHRVSGSLERRVVEYVDHLHEHFVDPVVIERGRYRVPTVPGIQHHDETRVACERSRIRTARPGGRS